jgi:hypothetical protein
MPPTHQRANSASSSHWADDLGYGHIGHWTCIRLGLWSTGSLGIIEIVENPSERSIGSCISRRITNNLAPNTAETPVSPCW